MSQLEVAATSNFRAVIVNGMTEDAVYSVRVIASNDAGDGPPSEETLGRPQDSLPRLIARTVNRQTLTLRFSEQLDPNAVPAATNFVVKADGGLIMVDSVAISGDEVILTLHHAVTAATHSVLVRYDKPTDPSAVFLQDTNGNYANIRQHHELLEVVNITPQSSVQPLTAQFTNMPSSHDGRTRFTLRHRIQRAGLGSEMGWPGTTCWRSREAQSSARPGRTGARISSSSMSGLTPRATSSSSCPVIGPVTG